MIDIAARNFLVSIKPDGNPILVIKIKLYYNQKKLNSIIFFKK